MNNLLKSSKEFSSELLVQRCGPGIRLLKPEQPNYQNDTRFSVDQVFKIPLNFYLLDTQSTIHLVNRYTAESCGYLSEAWAVGRSIRDVAKRATAERVIANDRRIVESKAMAVCHESIVRQDEKDVSVISIKFPWLNDKYEVIGLFGCSILVEGQNYQAFASAINQLIVSGLFSHSPALVDSLLPGLRCGDVFFERVEADIMYYLVRGRSSKQIGKSLNLSPRTIEHRLERIRLNTGCATKAELVEQYLRYFI